MGARKTKGVGPGGWDQSVRDRIQTSMIVNRLQDHIAGNVEMSRTQVQAAGILLKKTIPDLTAIEGTLDLSVRKHEDMLKELDE